MSLIALDVEGTLITSSSINTQVSQYLAFFSGIGWQIVLATNAYGQGLQKYASIFEKTGIAPYIDDYFPLGSSSQDSKYQKLEQYRAQYGLNSKKVIFFFDDILSNVLDTRAHGYCNSYHITIDAPLEYYLQKLMNECLR